VLGVTDVIYHVSVDDFYVF